MAKKSVRVSQKNKAIPKIKDSKASLSKQKITLEKFRRMATVIQDSNDAITFQNLEGNILAWNRGAEKMYGYSEAEALNMNIVDTVPAEYQEEARQFIASLKRGELVPNLETKRKHKNGVIIDVWLTNTKLTDDKGKLTGIATTERDITAQTQTLERFRRMTTVIKDSNDAITFQDLEGNILAWNRGAELMYGYSEAEALSMNIVDTVPSDYQEEARQFIALLKRGELVPNLETKRKHKDGRIIDVWLTNTKLTNDTGKLTGIATTERDISEQVGSLERFRRMATVIQDSNDAITFQDLEGNILAWNRGAEKIYGYSEAEALKMNIVDTVPMEYQEEARQFIASLKRGELLPNLETKRKHKDGRIIDVWLTNTKLTGDKGKLTGIATTERDITERKQHEASLKEKFRELDYLREGQIALSESMRGQQDLSRLGQSILSHLVPFTNAQVGAFYLVSSDKKLQRISGYALPEIEGHERPINFGVGLVGQVALEKRTLLIEDVPSNYFNKIQSTFGELAPKSLLICPILYENEVNGVIELGSLHSFTEHQRAFLSHVSANIGIAINTSDVRNKVQDLLEQSQTLNDKLQTQQEELNKAQVLLEEKATEVQRGSQYKTEFLANMSHELRTPLNSSLILAKLLMDNGKGNLTEDQIKYASSIYSSGNDLLNLINDILDLSKVEAGKLDIRVEDVLLSRVMDGLNETFQTLAQEKNVRFEVTCENSLPQFFQTDRQRLDQILKNLISNAFKFTQDGAVKIRIFHHSNEHIGFEVTDSGIGIPKEQQEIIFEAFRQADGTTNRKFGGTGLGLSISRDLARLLGGSIKVTSNPGKGSCFTLILPEFYNEELIATTPAKKITVKSVGSSKKLLDDVTLILKNNRGPEQLFEGIKILLVDDDIRNIFALTSALEQQGATVIIGRNGYEALDKLEQDPKIDLVLMDIMMPEMDGLEATRRIRKQKKFDNLPIVAVTAKAMREDQQICLEAGANDYLSKPVNLDKLLSIIRVWAP